MDQSSSPRLLVFTANTAWNIAHFRAPLLRAFKAQGFQLLAIAPKDRSAKDLESFGCAFEALPVPAHSRNPLADLVLFWNYLRPLRKYRPVALVSFTVKSNIYGGLAARLLGIPQIGNISGLETAFIEGGWLGRMVMVLYRIGIGGVFQIFFQNPDDRDFFLLTG